MGREKPKNNVMLIISIMLGYALTYMDKNMIATAIIPLETELSLNASQSGLLMSMFFIGYTVMQFPSGWLSDKIGPKKVLLISMGTILIATIFFGFVSALVLLMVIRLLAGLGHAGIPTSSTKVVANNIQPKQKMFVQSLILSTSGIGGILAFTLGSTLINMSWRYAYYGLAVLYAVSIIMIFFFFPKQKKNPIGGQEKKEDKVKISVVFKEKNVFALFAALLFLNIVLYGYLSWLPSFYETNFGFDLKAISITLSINAILMSVGALSSSIMVDKVFKGNDKRFALISILVCAIACIVFAMTNSLVMSITMMFIFTLSSNAVFVTLFSWPHKLIRQEVIGSSIAIINMGSTIGGFLSPTITGYLITAFGGNYSVAFIAMGLSAVVCGFVILLVKTKPVSNGEYKFN
ncbi:MFS transporter [Oceanobacillus arenosus]|uniref:MFS transporter n=1 Tax=Oceanobacillus arenosus TaxID=1229153 RepID=A0A3D8PQ24_9BACI|nr:MFS transporter [Oceanobacillus arenosus]RDW18074.1 MFS transporter [Oceanobacillus arenosus]